MEALLYLYTFFFFLGVTFMSPVLLVCSAVDGLTCNRAAQVDLGLF
jgi:hypothetical protein